MPSGTIVMTLVRWTSTKQRKPVETDSLSGETDSIRRPQRVGLRLQRRFNVWQSD
jgi:hypothetical protein